MKQLILIAMIFVAGTTAIANPTTVQNDGDEDAATLTALYKSLMGADVVEGTLSVQITMDESVSDMMLLAMNTTEEKLVVMKIFDDLGRDVFAHRELELLAGNNYEALNLSELPAGEYYMTLSQNGKSTTRRFVVE
jgi:hypothetical protein